MKRKVVVAVIDSGVDTSDEKLNDKDIRDIYYEDGSFKSRYIGEINHHGTEVIKVLLKEAPDIQIVSIKILQENNRCSVTAIIEAVRYAVRIRVDIINLSLGSCVSRTRKVSELELACNEAVEHGIVVFAADNNDPRLNSYPASFRNVISVNTPDGLDQYCQVRYEDQAVEFSENYVYIPDAKRVIVRKGNSFLCPMLVGLFCRFYEEYEKKEQLVLQFMELLKELSKHDNISKIFFDKKNPKDIRAMMDKRISFFADDMDFNNRNLYEYYRTVSKVTWSFSEIFGRTVEEMKLELNKNDILFIGVLSNRFLREQEDFVHQLVQLAVSMKKIIVTTIPIINTFDRMKLTKQDNRMIRSIYK